MNKPPVSGRLAQMGLPLTLRDDATFDNFHAGAGNNQLVVDALQAACAAAGARVVFLHGAAGSGCTHLLQAMCHQAADKQWTAIYLPLNEFMAENPEHILPGLEALDVVCLDNVHAVLGNPEWEEALFHLMNRLRDAKRLLLVAADQPPAQLPVQLADLQSRLAAATVFRLDWPGDDDRLALLKQRAASRGLVLEDDPARFILSRAPRATGELIALLDKLDAAALAQQRKLTLPFIKEVMGW
ncbi:MAG TPA: DnaA regulatory inactivator Hda [Pseudomonadales bacterium]